MCEQYLFLSDYTEGFQIDTSGFFKKLFEETVEMNTEI